MNGDRATQSHVIPSAIQKATASSPKMPERLRARLLHTRAFNMKLITRRAPLYCGIGAAAAAAAARCDLSPPVGCCRGIVCTRFFSLRRRGKKQRIGSRQAQLLLQEKIQHTLDLLSHPHKLLEDNGMNNMTFAKIRANYGFPERRLVS